jgi:trk system potassium uptake protein TrkA
MNRITEGLLPSDDTGGPRAQSAFVVGLGRFGGALAQRLVALGVEVLAIDVSQELVNEWAERLTDVRLADGTNPAVLRQLGASDFDAAVVAIGSSLEASILTTSGLADVGAPNIWAKAVTNEHGRILERVGAHHVVYPERQAGERVARIVSGKVLDYFPLDDGFAIVELATPAHYVGATLGDSDIRSEFGVTVVCIKPKAGAFTYATSETELAAGDLLVFAGTMEDIERFTERMTS